MDIDKESRLGILEAAAKADIIEPFRVHNWECSIEGKFPNGEYVVINLKKLNIEFKIAFLYSCATANSVYKILDQAVDLIVLNGGFYHLEAYAYGIQTAVIEKSSIQSYVVQWNALVSDGKISAGGPKKPKPKPREFVSHIQSENPVNQIWSRIRQFKTRGIARKLIDERYSALKVSFSNEILEAEI